VGPGLGFDSDDNAANVYWKNGEKSFPLLPKQDLAVALIRLIAERYAASYGAEIQPERPAIAVRD
jgi:phosphopantothenoylcysteine decarboxylase/phosphopantothenate--cysteine ligase